MSRAKDLTRNALIGAARTRFGDRLLRFYVDNGFPAEGVPAAHEPAPAGNELPTLRAHEPRLEADHELLQAFWDRVVSEYRPSPTFADVTEQPEDDTVPPLDRRGVDLSRLSDDQRQWAEHGFVVKKRFVPDDVLDAYWEVRSKLNRPHGWSCNTPYMHVPEVLDLSVHKPLMDLLGELIGEPMAVNLNLTGIVSTERNWHQDDYLNPPLVNGWYAAVWFAVGDIDPDSGPFQFVPGSHRWPVLRRDRVRMFLTPEERAAGDWPRYTERFLDELLEKEIAERGGDVQTFVGEKGDILVWHGRLMHRGSAPRLPGTIRKSFIAHYTGLSHWALGPKVGQHPEGGLYFLSDEPLDA